MAESIHNQIIAALVTRLEALEEDGGSTCWYTPNRVVVVNSYERLLADPTIKHIYALRPAEETHEEHHTGSSAAGGGLRAIAEFYLLMMRRDEREAMNPFEEATPTRATIVDRIVRDVLRALFLDVTLGGLAINIVQGSLVIDRDLDIEGKWAVAEARFGIDYEYLAGTP